MPVLKSESREIRSQTDLVQVHQEVRKWVLELSFTLVDQTSRMVTTASELTRNTLEYGGGGTVLLELVQDGARRGLRLTFKDTGPGITNIGVALPDGYTSGNGPGLGPGGAKGFVKEFEIESTVGKEARAKIARWK